MSTHETVAERLAKARQRVHGAHEARQKKHAEALQSVLQQRAAKVIAAQGAAQPPPKATEAS